MPPTLSATDAEYDSDYAHHLMDSLDARGRSSFRRAVEALLLVGLGCGILLSVFSYNPFDSTGDTAGIGAVQNLLGRPGASLANVMMQTIGWGGIILGILLVYIGTRAIFWPKKQLSKTDKWGRFFLSLGAVIFGTATLSAFPIPQP